MVGCLYYTSNKLDGTELNEWSKETIKASGLPIISCTQLPIDFGNNVVYTEDWHKDGERLGRSHSILYKQILTGLRAAKQKYLFFCEHDVLYHPSHFEFVPPRDDVYYYNNSVWKYRLSDRKVIGYDCTWTSQLCANRELLISHYEKRLKMIEEGKRAYGYEPGTGQSKRIDNVGAQNWETEFYNIDVRHGDNWTGVRRMDPSEFSDKKNCQNWKETTVEEIRGWDTERLLSL